jgi:hypothetical protein
MFISQPAALTRMDVTINGIFLIFYILKFVLKDAENNSLQLFFRIICSKINNKVTKLVSLTMLKHRENVAA